METPENLKTVDILKESRIVKKTEQALAEVGITDYSYGPTEKGGVQFIIKLPAEHIQDVKKQMSSYLGFIESTEFLKKWGIPLLNKIRAVKDLNYEVVQGEKEDEMILRVFKDKWKNATRI
jgi:hypothetical protein